MNKPQTATEILRSNAKWLQEHERFVIENIYLEEHKRIVEAGGGQYVKSMCFGNLVLFNSPQSNSTLALKENVLTSEAVRIRIKQSNEAFGISSLA